MFISGVQQPHWRNQYVCTHCTRALGDTEFVSPLHNLCLGDTHNKVLFPHCTICALGDTCIYIQVLRQTKRSNKLCFAFLNVHSFCSLQLQEHPPNQAKQCECEICHCSWVSCCLLLLFLHSTTFYVVDMGRPFRYQTTAMVTHHDEYDYSELCSKLRPAGVTKGNYEMVQDNPPLYFFVFRAMTLGLHHLIKGSTWVVRTSFM